MTMWRSPHWAVLTPSFFTGIHGLPKSFGFKTEISKWKTKGYLFSFDLLYQFSIKLSQLFGCKISRRLALSLKKMLALHLLLSLLRGQTCPSNGHKICSRVGFPGGSDGLESAHNAGDPGLIPGSGRCPGNGMAYPPQYSFLENSMYRGYSPWGCKESGKTEQLTPCLKLLR